MLTFALITGGLANLFMATRQLGIHTRSRMLTGELGRYYLDRLQMHVREDTWDEAPDSPSPNNLLTVGNYRSTNLPGSFTDYSGYTIVDELDEAGFEEIEDPTIRDITYYPVYEVSDKDGLRKVKLIICWQELSD